MRRRGTAGLTLMELMVVMTIMAVVLGMSSAFLSKLNRGYRFTSSVNQVATTIRSARNYALSSGSLSGVQIVELDGSWRIAALSQKAIAHWHLEGSGSDKSGGFSLTGGAGLVEGKVGNGVMLIEGGKLTAGPTAKLPAGLGVAISGWFYPMGGGGGQQTLFDFGGALIVRLDGDNSVNASVGGKKVRTPPGVMVPFKWTQVEVVYDRASLSLSIDGVLLAEVACVAPLPRSAKAFTVGHAKSSFIGRVDEVALSTIFRPEEVILPDGVEVTQTVAQVRFDRQGYLDPLHHSGPALIWIYSKRESQWRLITISPMGRVRITEHDTGPLPKPKKKRKKSKTGSVSTVKQKSGN